MYEEQYNIINVKAWVNSLRKFCLRNTHGCAWAIQLYRYVIMLRNDNIYITCVCGVILGVYPNQGKLKNLPHHNGNRTGDPWFASSMRC